MYIRQTYSYCLYAYLSVVSLLRSVQTYLRSAATMSSQASTIIRYDGPALENHLMEIDDFAPALLGLSELVNVANETVYGSSTSVKVMVNIDREQMCIEFAVHVMQTVAEQIGMFMSSGELPSAEALLEYIGLVFRPGHLGLIAFLTWLAENKGAIAKFGLKKVQNEDGSTTFQINNNKINILPITVIRTVNNIFTNPRSLPAVKKFIKPSTKEGVERISWGEDREMQGGISGEQAEDIYSLEENLLLPDSDKSISTAETCVKVKKPDLLGNSKWDVIYLGRNTSVKIEDSEWLDSVKRGLVAMTAGVQLKVTLRTEVPVDKELEAVGEPSYYITQVHEVISPDGEENMDLFEDTPNE